MLVNQGIPGLSRPVALVADGTTVAARSGAVRPVTGNLAVLPPGSPPFGSNIHVRVTTPDGVTRPYVVDPQWAMDGLAMPPAERPAPAVTPDLRGLTQWQAAATLHAWGLRVGGETSAPSATAPVEAVIGQDPAPGSPAPAAGTGVTPVFASPALESRVPLDRSLPIRMSRASWLGPRMRAKARAARLGALRGTPAVLVALPAGTPARRPGRVRVERLSSPGVPVVMVSGTADVSRSPFTPFDAPVLSDPPAVCAPPSACAARPSPCWSTASCASCAAFPRRRRRRARPTTSP